MASTQDGTVFPEDEPDMEEDEESSDDDELEENDDVLVVNDEEEEEYDEEDLNSVSTTATAAVPSAPAITVAFPSMFSPAAASASASASVVTVAVPPIVNEDPDPKRLRVTEAISVQEEKKPLPPQLDESRRLFQRLWTDEDEIELLKGFLEYTSQRGNAHHHDTALFYDQIKSKLQLDFNKNQLVEKLRRLKKKYRNIVSKINSGKDFSFKTPHDQATFEISSKIWSCSGAPIVNVLDDEDGHHNNNNHVHSSNDLKPHYSSVVLINNSEEKNTPKSRKRSRSKAGVNENVVLMNNSENLHVNNSTPVGGGSSGSGSGTSNAIAGIVEDTVKSCLSPLFKELLNNVTGGMGGARGFGGFAMNTVMPLGFGGGTMGFGGGTMGFGSSGGEMADEKWRKQQILELEVYSKRLELVQDQIKTALDELRSTGG